MRKSPQQFTITADNKKPRTYTFNLGFYDFTQIIAATRRTPRQRIDNSKEIEIELSNLLLKFKYQKENPQ